MDYTILSLPFGNLPTQYKSEKIPKLFFVGRKGRLRHSGSCSIRASRNSGEDAGSAPHALHQDVLTYHS